MSMQKHKKQDQEPDVDEHPTQEGQKGGSKPKQKPKGKNPSNPPGDDLSD